MSYLCGKAAAPGGIYKPSRCNYNVNFISVTQMSQRRANKTNTLVDHFRHVEANIPTYFCFYFLGLEGNGGGGKTEDTTAEFGL